MLAKDRRLRRVLMVAYHFPPLAGSSGIQRTLRFVQQLPALGWEPVVLTIASAAYERTNDDLLKDVPAHVHVHRAWGLDTAQQLSFKGRYPGMLARPDRWMTWRFGAVGAGLKLIRELGISALWSTYPIATAHNIGADLQARSGLPWIADFRDPMAQPTYPTDPTTRRQFLEIEERVVQAAAACVFTTPGAMQDYRNRYPHGRARWKVIENGYDEASFVSAEVHSQRRTLTPGKLTLLHSGIVYPWERDPTHLFQALGQLKRETPRLAARLQLRFRAAVHDDLLHSLAEQYQITELIDIAPPVAYREALAEMMDTDALLVLQASNCNAQIPAKLYEALRSRRPILCLSDPLGDTVSVIRKAGMDSYAPLDNPEAIRALLRRFAEAPNSFPLPDAAAVARASRESKSAELAVLLDEVCKR